MRVLLPPLDEEVGNAEEKLYADRSHFTFAHPSFESGNMISDSTINRTQNRSFRRRKSAHA